jgi:mRNA interferase MazF
LTTSAPQPKRGEIWEINLDPTVGVEMQKKRPVVVISSDAAGRLPIKLISPITGWDNRYSNNFWHVKISPNASNGLSKVSAVDVLQSRGVDTARFTKKVGRLDAGLMEDIAAAMAALVEHV